MFLNVFYFLILTASVKHVSNNMFDPQFLFGASTSSYQTEGAWNTSGKGENIWDHLTHNNPQLIIDKSNGDIACDSYHKYQEDISLLQNLGVNFHRFSVSWARILPNGHPNKVNSEGLDHYNSLIDALVAKNITPMLTIYHWDLPQHLQMLGGWTNPNIVMWYTEYAQLLLDNFADRVKFWITINDPYQVCQQGYGDGNKAPSINMSGRADYLCNHHLLKAHAAVYHLFNDSYRMINDGNMGITIGAQWLEPNTTKDEDAAERARQFRYGMYANPIFSEEGDYPDVVKQYVAAKSAKQGFSRTRLYEFTNDEINYIKGTSDFFGLNHFTTELVTNSDTNTMQISFENDEGVISWFDPNWPWDGANRFPIVPWGFRKLLAWIKNTYDNPDIYITENGCADFEVFKDITRVSYYAQYLEALLEAINDDNVTAKSYAVWSLLDNFEWRYGYTYRYGLYYVDFNDTERPRREKSSAEYYRNVIQSRTVGKFTLT